tara:strand:+ start:1937 stop:2638 length:702 start_codon:yes stop_codon:yes gene_type:complete
MNLFKNVHESWIPLLHSLAYQEPMVKFLESLRNVSFQPDMSKIFNVFEMPVEDIKVVILGQNPYPQPGTAVGRAYAVPKTRKMPQLLQFIKEEVFKDKELSTDWQTLDHWTKQGVFLLNTSLTIETDGTGHSANWRDFTNTVITFISQQNPCIWMLWGRNAQGFMDRINNPLRVKGYDRETIEDIPIDPILNYIIPGDHPVRLMEEEIESFSNDGFYYTNKILEKRSLTQIIW